MVKSDTSYVAVQAGQAGQPLEYVGNLVWYTVNQTRITREDLELIFSQTGLDPKLLPQPLNARDALRRAATKNDGTRRGMDQGRQAIFMVREVSKDKTRLIYDLVREIRDEKNIRLSHRATVRLILAADTLQATALTPETPLSPAELEFAAVLQEGELEVVQEIVADFQRFSTHYDEGHVRDLVARILGTCAPVNVRESGGVYFTPKKHEMTVQALKRMLTDLGEFCTADRRSKLAMTPVIDAAEIDLQECLEEQLTKSAESLIVEMTRILESGRKVRQETAAGYVTRCQDLQRMMDEYAEMLNAERIVSETKVQIAMKQALSMLGRLETPAAVGE